MFRCPLCNSYLIAKIEDDLMFCCENYPECEFVTTWDCDSNGFHTVCGEDVSHSDLTELFERGFDHENDA